MRQRSTQVQIRPEELGKKVLAFVRDDYKHTKEVGGFKVSLFTNRDGGVAVPFEVYAQNWHDSDLNFLDPNTQEPLGEYIPAEVETERRELTAQTELIETIKQFVQIQALQTITPEMAKKLGIANPADVINGDTVDDPGFDKKTRLAAQEVLSTHWKKRMEAYREVKDMSVIRCIAETLEDEKTLSKINQEILKDAKSQWGIDPKSEAEEDNLPNFTPDMSPHNFSMPESPTL
jgi:hypothetical protein